MPEMQPYVLDAYQRAQRVMDAWRDEDWADYADLARRFAHVLADAEKRAAAWEADSIADTVLALADDFLAAFPPDDAGIDVDEAYDWLIAQAAAFRQAAVDPAGSPHNSFPHRPVHVTPASHQKLAGQPHAGTPEAPGAG